LGKLQTENLRNNNLISYHMYTTHEIHHIKKIKINNGAIPFKKKDGDGLKCC